MFIFRAIEAATRILARAAAWGAIVMMLCQAFAVVARYVFGYGIIAVQEVVVYGHSLLFLLGAAYLLQKNQHVRVDIFYLMFSDQFRRWVDFIGLAFFVLPVAVVVCWFSAPYAMKSWAVLEGSRQPGGIPAVFILKTAMVVFSLSLVLQTLATLGAAIMGAPNDQWRSLSGEKRSE